MGWGGEEVWAAIAPEGLLLASQARLARSLRAAYDARQLAAGRRSWPAAPVDTLDGWCKQSWAAVGDRVCLSGAQEERLWEAAIGEVAGETGWLDLAATAAAAAQAWELAQLWALPLSGAAWEETEDCAAFQQWARVLARRCREGNWITAPELPAALAAALGGGRLAAPARVALAGFDRLNPRQQQLVEALAAAGARVERREEAGAAAPPWRVYPDPGAELRAAAVWAREQVERGRAASAPVAVILPDLEGQREAVERIFTEVLHPGRAPWSEEARAFHLSLGAPLAEHPLVAAALRLAEIQAQREPVEPRAVLEWIRSPFLAAADSEAAARARLERQLRARRRPLWRWEEVRREAAEAGCGQLASCLGQVRTLRRGWPRRQSYGGWAASLQALWEAAGWPGERRLGSADYQAQVAWERLLDAWVGLDAVAGGEPPEAAEALARLRRLAAGRIFQPEAAAAPVEILGWLEAAGQSFAATWVAGLHNGAVPAAARPHPFLPPSLQRALGLPRATAAGEAEFAQRVWQRVCAAGGELVASFAAADASGNPQQASPLSAGAAFAPTTAEPEVAPAAAASESLEDGEAPACGAEERRGGSELLKEQSLCPFRAFAHLRLHAAAGEKIEPGLDAATRGTLVHALLCRLWQWLESSERLAALTAAELEQAVEARAAEVVAAEKRLQHLPALAELERQRLRDLALEWLGAERGRQPFRIVELEAKLPAHFAGLELSLRSDRVDELAGGGLVIVDYKTGSASASEWASWRPRDPQLPLYLVTQPRPEAVAALALGRVKAGAMSWSLRERDRNLVLADPRRAKVPPGGWATQVREWRAVLERLAEEYQRGAAAVDPLSGACDSCDLHALCRIHEQAAAQPYPGEEEDRAEEVEHG